MKASFKFHDSRLQLRFESIIILHIAFDIGSTLYKSKHCNYHKSYMAQTKLPENKQEIIDTYAQKKGDTGSPEVQVALLSFKIQRLTNHLEGNKKDNHSRRGLLKVIAKRRRILNYLQKLEEKRYKELIKKIGLKK